MSLLLIGNSIFLSTIFLLKMKDLLNSIYKIFAKTGASNSADRTEGYPEYLKEAEKLNLDVNDYLDDHLGWVKPLPVLEEVVFPYLEKIKPEKILELGPGTGRWTRHIIKKASEIDCSEFDLVDRSQWITDFLKSYFANVNFVHPFKNNGMKLPFSENYFDFIFSQGVFIELKPSFVLNYAKEFSRVLKPGGYCIFDYFDYESDDGWKYFIEESEKGNIYYTFYSDKTIGKIFEPTGFVIKNRFVFGKAKFVVLQKI